MQPELNLDYPAVIQERSVWQAAAGSAANDVACCPSTVWLVLLSVAWGADRRQCCTQGGGRTCCYILLTALC